MESFKEINKKGVTIVLVTHDSKVAAYANRIVFMKDGKILTELEHIKKRNQDIQNDNDIDNINKISCIKFNESFNRLLHTSFRKTIIFLKKTQECAILLLI